MDTYSRAAIVNDPLWKAMANLITCSNAFMNDNALELLVMFIISVSCSFLNLTESPNSSLLFPNGRKEFVDDVMLYFETVKREYRGDVPPS